MPHTPAPWNWNGTCLVAESTRDYPEGYAVAKVFNQSDVALICAAPTMLEALQRCAAILARYPKHDEAWAQARAAIRAATGE